ncbi:MAG: nitronate monooxygenase [Actinomycetia bacterium]|nr:nitronate monooxygenase [Actinomycetes bacterium]
MVMFPPRALTTASTRLLLALADHDYGRPVVLAFMSSVPIQSSKISALVERIVYLAVSSTEIRHDAAIAYTGRAVIGKEETTLRLPTVNCGPQLGTVGRNLEDPTMANALHTHLCDELGCAYPIFGFTHSVDAAIAVTMSGGIGIWGGTRSTPEEIEAALTRMHLELGDLPYGIDLVIPPGMPEKDNRAEVEAAIPEQHRQFVADLRERYGVPDDGLPGMRTRFIRSEASARAQVDVVLDSNLPILALGIGSPSWVIEPAKERGIKLVSLVGQPKHAERALQAGADIVVAQGYDAGAHTGPVGTFSLVPQIVDVCGEVPVVAAGGVATGRHIAAALAMGAVGVWTGTLWLVCEEEHKDPKVVDKLIAAGSADTVISRANSGKTFRQIRTSWSDEWSSEGAPSPLKMPYQDVLVGDMLGQIDRHGVGPLMHSGAGQSVGYLNAPSTVAETMSRLVEETNDALHRIGR